MPLSLRISFGARSAYFGREPAFEEVGWLDHVVVDADQNQVFEPHGCPPREPDVGVSVRRHVGRQSQTTGSAGGARNTMPVICGASASGSRRRFGQPVEELREQRPSSPCARGAGRGTCAGPTRTRGAASAAGRCRTPRRSPSSARRGSPSRCSPRSSSPAGIGHAFDLGVARRGAHDAEQRRLPAQALLDRLRHQAAVGAQRVELVGVGEQAEEQVARRAVRRLGAGREQQPEERADLVVGRVRCRRARPAASTEITSSDGCVRRSAMIAQK